MSQYKIDVKWQRKDKDFNYETYDRTHYVTFNGGSILECSAAPEFFGKAELVNPEELLVASTSCCYMLTFLAIAAKQGIIVDSYEDKAIGVLGKNEKGRPYISEILLKPQITFSEEKPPETAILQKLYEKAHANCFITNSLISEVKIQPQ